MVHTTHYTVVFNSKYNYKPWETWLDRIQNYLRRSPWYMLVYDHNNTTYLLILHFSTALIWLSQSKFPGGGVLFSFLGKWITYSTYFLRWHFGGKRRFSLLKLQQIVYFFKVIPHHMEIVFLFFLIDPCVDVYF